MPLSLSFALSENYPGKQCLGRGETPPPPSSAKVQHTVVLPGEKEKRSLSYSYSSRTTEAEREEKRKKRGFCETIELPSTKAESGSPSSHNTRTRVTTTAEREKEKERGERIGRLLLLLHKGEGGNKGEKNVADSLLSLLPFQLIQKRTPERCLGKLRGREGSEGGSGAARRDTTRLFFVLQTRRKKHLSFISRQN